MFAFGHAPFFGSATKRCSFECLGFGATADGHGYGYGVVGFYSMTDASTNILYGYGTAFDVREPDPGSGATGVASTPSSKGGWILHGSGGKVVPFGDAT